MKRHADVAGLVRYLAARPVLADTDCKAHTFVPAFERFCADCLEHRENLKESEYRDWVEDVLSYRPAYRSFKASDSPDRITQLIAADAALCRDIADRGILVPIRLFIEPYYEPVRWVDVDGWHRLLTWKVMGREKIEYRVSAAELPRILEWIAEFDPGLEV
jgi:hypothetical protein